MVCREEQVKAIALADTTGQRRCQVVCWLQMRKRLRDVWTAIRQLLSIRGLLEVLGVKDFVIAIVVATGVFVWSYVQQVPAPVIFVLALVCLAVVLFVAFVIRVWHLIPTSLPDSVPTSVASKDVSQAGMAVASRPEVVIDYSYSEDGKDGQSPDAPLVLRNLSSAACAYSIQVLPLKTAEGVITFEPDLIPYIETLETTNVFASISDGSPLFKRRLPDFLFRSYRDTSTRGLFGTKIFTIRVRYKGIDGSTFETECEVRFTPWKKQTSVGRITCRVLPQVPGSHELAATTRRLREDLRTLYDRYTEASEFCKYPLSKRWRPFKCTVDFTQDIRDGLEWTRILTEHLTDTRDAFGAANKLRIFTELSISEYLVNFLEIPYADCIDALWKLEEAIKNSLQSMSTISSEADDR